MSLFTDNLHFQLFESVNQTGQSDWFCEPNQLIQKNELHF